MLEKQGQINHRKYAPKTIRNGDKVWVRLTLLDHVQKAGEDDDSQDDEEDEEEQLAHGGLQGQAEDLEAAGVAGQFEYSKHPHQPDHSEDAQRVCRLKHFKTYVMLPQP